MKVVMVGGSPRGEEGETSRIIRWLTDDLHQQGADVERYELVDMVIEPCRGCYECLTSGVCPPQDEAAEIHADWREADAVVLGSPNHLLSVSGLMKNFLDRSTALVPAETLAGRAGGVVVTGQGLGEERVAGYLQMVLEAMGADVRGALVGVPGGAGRFRDHDGLRERTRELARDLVTPAAEPPPPISREATVLRKFLQEFVEQSRDAELDGAEFFADREARDS